MTHSIKPKPGVMDIAPYVGGDSSVDGVQPLFKLSSNENPHGPSRKAIAAYGETAQKLALYPSTDHADLRAAIAKVYGLDAALITCGAGSDELIALLCQAYAGAGDEVLFTEHGFLMYRISALAAGATPVAAGETNRTADVDKLLAACTENTRLVFLANPNNPTGTMISEAEVARLADGLPDRALLVLDGAYAEYVAGFDGGADCVAARQNVVMTRTFSKIYGLSSLRVGWAFAPAHVIDVLNRVRGPFNVSASALAAASAALGDTAYTEFCRMENERWREWVRAEIAAVGVPSQASYGNFILADFGSAETAAACDEYLRNNGVIVRGVGGYDLPDCLRITVGDKPGCRVLVSLITEFMENQAK